MNRYFTQAQCPETSIAILNKSSIMDLLFSIFKSWVFKLDCNGDEGSISILDDIQPC